MTNIVVKIRDGEASAELTGILTTGMVGVPVIFDLGPEWDDLTIVAVIQGNGLTFDRPLLGTRQTTVPFEVLEKVGEHIYIGAEGCSKSGDLVIQSNMAVVEGTVRQGADPSGDTAMDHTQPFWAELMAEVEDLRENAVNTETFAQHDADPQAHGPIRELIQYMEARKLNITDIADDVYTRDNCLALSANMGVFLREKIDNDLLTVEKALQEDIKERVKTVNGIAPDENGNVAVEGGISAEEKTLILSLLRNATYTADMSSTFAQLEALWDGSGEDSGGDETHDHNYVDGTCTNCGAADLDYEEPERTEPVYQLAEATTFDGNIFIDTGVVICDFENGEEGKYKPFTICIDYEDDDWAWSNNYLFSCYYSESTPALSLFQWSGGSMNVKILGLETRGFSGATVNAGKIVMTREANMRECTLHVVVDGVVTSVAASAGNTAQSASSIILGAMSISADNTTVQNYFSGIINKFEIYDKVIDATAIAEFLGVSA